ncbi:MAG: efflux RND transporter periplasmic adaptor subunit, partial [Pseudomonadota bacterium]|nr:efflux RND transporter periplasmic adaptor subunit [Pseudomonadota bacterium]
VSVAQTRDLPLKLEAQGHLVALAQVDVRPQANGTIRAIHFKEGDEVRSGQVMFTIDSTDVAAQLARAQANAAQIKAQLDEAQRDLGRTQQLAKSRFYSTSAVDTSTSKAESLQAQYKAALADVDNTRVLVDHTRVTAPMGGLTGALSVHPGSVAQPGAAAALVNVAQVDPIGVDFTLPEGNLPALLAARGADNVQVTLDSADGPPLTGKLVFINNTVDTNTGTIALKAAFPNPRKLLWPGSFVRVDVTAGVSRAAVTLPPQSLLDGPTGRFVYVLDAADKVNAVTVTLLRVQDGLAVVTGLSGGERVVSEGQAVLKPGSTVRIAASATALARQVPASGVAR